MNKKYIWRRVLCTILCLTLVCVPVMAEETGDTSTSAVSVTGSGTAEDPYLLSTAAALLSFAEGTLLDSAENAIDNYDGLYFHIQGSTSGTNYGRINAASITPSTLLYDTENPFTGTIHVTTYGNYSCLVKAASHLMVADPNAQVIGLPANLFQTCVKQGSGTADDPFIIETATQLSALSGYLCSGGTTLDGYSNLLNLDGIRINTNVLEYHFRLGADIDMQGYNFQGIGATLYSTAWATNWGQAKPFCGNFDGNGKTVSNLYCNKTYGEMAGFFTRTQQANVHDLTLDNLHTVYKGGSAPMGKIAHTSTYTNVVLTNFWGENKLNPAEISNTHCDSAFVGRLENGSMESCSVEGGFAARTTGTGSGGLCGSVANSTITNCSIVLDPEKTSINYYTGLMFGWVYASGEGKTTTISGCTLSIKDQADDEYFTFAKLRNNDSSILACSIGPNVTVMDCTIYGNYMLGHRDANRIPKLKHVITYNAGTVENCNLVGKLSYEVWKPSVSMWVRDEGKYRESPYGQVVGVTSLPPTTKISYNSNEIKNVDKYTLSYSTTFTYIEPWGLKLAAALKENGELIPVEKYDNYGAYVIISDSETVPSAETMLESGTEYPMGGEQWTTASFNGTDRVQFRLNETLYTYELDQHIYVMFYIEYGGNIYYGSVKDRQELAILESIRDTSMAGNTIFTSLQQELVKAILNLYTATENYRASIGQ